jgi:acyl-[acyl-carrier-protein] desaturase
MDCSWYVQLSGRRGSRPAGPTRNPKHGLVLREYLTRSGMRSEADVADFEDRLFAERWRLPFDTARRMAMYGALQEGGTLLAYRAQRDRAELKGDDVLEATLRVPQPRRSRSC